MKPFKFVFEGIISSGNQSDIAIDDISFSKGCKTYQGTLPLAPPNPSPTSPSIVTTTTRTTVSSTINPSEQTTTTK